MHFHCQAFRHTSTSHLVGLFMICTVALGAQDTIQDTAPPVHSDVNALTHFTKKAEKKFGAEGKAAADFLIQHMPTTDKASLSSAFLFENLQLAMKARHEFPWATELNDDLFLNHVLPYATLDEPRDPWRADFYSQVRDLVSDCKSAGEAAQRINKDFFNTLNVHYSRERKRANQSPKESIEQGKASCTGLSIILVNACRSVGIPARIVGIPVWANKPGNHNWVEIWDAGEWKFTGADEYDAKGLNRGWFSGDAAKADASQWQHTIYATTWKQAGTYFPMVWDLKNKTVAAEAVTRRYVPVALAKDETKAAKAGMQTLQIRVISGDPKNRIITVIELLDSDGTLLHKSTSKAGTADWNDLATIPLKPSSDKSKPSLGRLRLTRESDSGLERREHKLTPGDLATKVLELDWQALSQLAASPKPATPTQLAATPATVWAAIKQQKQPEALKVLQAKQVTVDSATMPWLEKRFGDKPKAGHALFISLHGGGGAPKDVNDQQWENQIRLYEPKEGIVVAPRAPGNTWDLWHKAHVDPCFEALIEAFVVAGEVDPNRVYLLGYSAGGDGVYQVAPRLAHRFAAAAMMAGHPNESKPLGLYNLPFAIYCGGKDSAYKRNEVAAAWGKQLDELQAKAGKGAYIHKTTIYPEAGHWMNGEDREAIPWMTKFERNPWPKRIVWHQDNVTHDRFYWLQLPKGSAQKGQTIWAEVQGQEIRIRSEAPAEDKAKKITELQLYLHPKLIDLTQEITVIMDGLRSTHTAKVTETAMRDSLNPLADPKQMAYARITIHTNKAL